MYQAPRKGEGGVFGGTVLSTKVETLEHFFTKMMIMKLLQEKKHKALIEQSVGNGTVDCYDYTTCYAYECEPRIDLKKLQMKLEKYSLGGAKEVVMIPYEKLWEELGIPRENLFKWKKAIEKYLNC